MALQPPWFRLERADLVGESSINNYFLTHQICLYYNIFLNYLVFVEDDDGGDDKYHNDDNCH